ncbi:hypothetical protein VINE108521_16415 [Vibrio neonatus]
MIASGLIPWVEEDMMAYVDKFNEAKNNFDK